MLKNVERLARGMEHSDRTENQNNPTMPDAGHGANLTRVEFWATLSPRERDFFSALNEQFNTSFMHAKRVK